MFDHFQLLFKIVRTINKGKAFNTELLLIKIDQYFLLHLIYLVFARNFQTSYLEVTNLNTRIRNHFFFFKQKLT